MLNFFLNKRISILYFIPFFLGLITVLSFQPFNFSLINFIVLPILFLLIVYVNKGSKSTYRKKPYRKNLFILGFVFSFGFYLAGVFWISNSLTFDDNFRFLIPFAIIFIPFFLSFFNALIIMIIGQFLSYNFPSVLLFSASLALSDYIRGKILTGFPWNLWGYSFSWVNEGLQTLNIFGLYAFNLIVITIFTIPAVFFLRHNLNKKIIILSFFFIFIFLNFIYGTYSINKNKSLINYISKDEKIFVKVVSPNFKLKYDQSINEISTKLQKLIRYSDPDPGKKTYFIWPEGVFAGFNYNKILVFREMIKENFSKNHFIIFGVNTIDIKTNEYLNSLVIVNNNFEILHQYDKIKLVPFGEFLPFENFFEKVGLKKITQGYGSFSKGKKQDNIIIDKVNILPLICYEIIFPELAQSVDKTNLIINISEDGWFGNTIGPHQHFAKAIFRSIENNSFLVRSANKGISAVIDNKGQIVKRLDINETGNIEAFIPLFKTEYKSKNDLIFFILLFTYLFIFLFFKIRSNGKQ